jgi:hypothetical protein
MLRAIALAALVALFMASLLMPDGQRFCAPARSAWAVSYRRGLARRAVRQAAAMSAGGGRAWKLASWRTPSG